LLEHTGLVGDDTLPRQHDRTQWPAMKERLTEVFKTKTRGEWCEIMEGTDVCFAPVLTTAEAAAHPHNQHRGVFVERNGVLQAQPAPRFDRTPGGIERPPAFPGQHTDEVLGEWGFAADAIAKLRETGAIK
jgi:alpha-methylacyl-CoA racemase